MKRSLLAAALLLIVAAGSAQASVQLFDRGLPTDNLNNDAGSNRSNVEWADNETLATDAFYLPGDDFTLSGSGTYIVDTIRVWSTTNDPTLSLLGGLAGGCDHDDFELVRCNAGNV